MSDPKFEREWSEALRRLSLILSGCWMVSLITTPFGPGTDMDYLVCLKNVHGEKVKAYGPNLAIAINRAVDNANKLDPRFAEVERQIAKELA